MQRYFYQKYTELIELSQYVWEAMNTIFPIASTSTIVGQLPTGEDEEEVLEPSIIR